MHLVSPTNFRLGKTFPWKGNLAIGENNGQIAGGGNLSLALGAEQLLYSLLAPHDLFPVRAVFRYNTKTGIWHLNMLYAPQIKEQDVAPMFINIEAIESWLFSSRALNPYHEYRARTFFANIRKKTARFPVIARIHRVGPWLTQRMFRGVLPMTWYKGPARTANYALARYIAARRTNRRTHLIIQKRIVRVYRKKRRQFSTPLTAAPLLNDRLLGQNMSSLIGRHLKVVSMNVFSYLVKKGTMSFQNHQRHFWNSAYRGRRWSYANYWDLLNAFYLLSTFRHAEHLLLSLLTSMLPSVVKPRRVFYFLDAVIKNLPQIQARFSCFRVTIRGKLAGGTKRTKHYTIGYGRLAINSLAEEATNNFARFAHRFGEFGMSFVMCRKMALNAARTQYHNTQAALQKGEGLLHRPIKKQSATVIINLVSAAA